MAVNRLYHLLKGGKPMSARENYTRRQDELFALLIADPSRAIYPRGILDAPEGVAEYARRADQIVALYWQELAQETLQQRWQPPQVSA
jgi:hypothetical protein